MADTITLSAKERAEAGKGLATMRAAGDVPAALYGHDVKPRSIAVPELAFGRAYRDAGENTVIALSIEGGKPVNALIKETQRHPITNRFIHADFFQVRMDEAIEANVPLEFIGESPAVRETGGILVRALDEVEVSALPADLPHTIQVDLTVLATFEDVIKVKDLPVSKKVKVNADPETVVALVEAPRSEAELAKLDEKVETDVTKVEKVEEKKETTDEKAA